MSQHINENSVPRVLATYNEWAKLHPALNDTNNIDTTELQKLLANQNTDPSTMSSVLAELLRRTDIERRKEEEEMRREKFQQQLSQLEMHKEGQQLEFGWLEGGCFDEWSETSSECDSNDSEESVAENRARFEKIAEKNKVTARRVDEVIETAG